MIRPVIALLAALSLGQVASAELAPDPTVLVEDNDREMNKAILAARKTLPAFLANTVDAEGYGPRGGFLKVRFEVNAQGATDENIWVGPFANFEGQDFVGLLANQPVAMPGLNAGDQVSFSYDMIVDWNLDAGDGRYYGDYTTRVVIARLDPSEAAAFKDRFIDPPVPAEWP